MFRTEYSFMVLLGKQYIYTSDLFSNSSLDPCIRYVVIRASESYKIRLFSLPRIVFKNVDTLLGLFSSFFLKVLKNIQPNKRK